jgi:transposase
MLANFYGQVLIEPTTVEHNQAGFDAAVQRVRDAVAHYGVKDIVVVVERTGRYHGPIQRAFTKAGYEVRMIHPFATKQFRQPADPGNKTDNTDLSAIFRAAVSGFGLLEHEPDPLFVRLQLLARHRRSLVRKKVTIQQKMLEHLHSFMPGYSNCFADVFDSPIVLWVASHIGSASGIMQAGVVGLIDQLQKAGIRKHTPTVEKIVAWARSAPAPEEPASLHHRFFLDLDADRVSKLRTITTLEGELAEHLVQTPYVLLLGIPGISVVSAAEFAGEAGPIERYTKGRSISGRAGLYPARYQSDQVDRCNGALIQHANRDLRHAIMIIAENLLVCNNHFRVLAAAWRLKGKDPRDICVKAAGRFCRIAYQMVAGRLTYQHPCAKERDYVLEKLIRFSNEHDSAADQLKRNLDAAAGQLPQTAHAEEAASLVEELARVRKQRGTGPQLLSKILPEVLAKLGVRLVTSHESGESDPT